MGKFQWFATFIKKDVQCFFNLNLANDSFQLLCLGAWGSLCHWIYVPMQVLADYEVAGIELPLCPSLSLQSVFSNPLVTFCGLSLGFLWFVHTLSELWVAKLQLPYSCCIGNYAPWIIWPDCTTLLWTAHKSTESIWESHCRVGSGKK